MVGALYLQDERDFFEFPMRDCKTCPYALTAPDVKIGHYLAKPDPMGWAGRSLCHWARAFPEPKALAGDPTMQRCWPQTPNGRRIL